MGATETRWCSVAEKDAEAAFNKEMDDDKKLLINYNLRSAAGRNNRLLKKKRQKILDAYNVMLAELPRTRR